MTKIQPVYLDTNFCRDPQVLRKSFGPNLGLLLDLLVFAAARTHVAEGHRRSELLPAQGEGRWLRFHTSDFYREFGYNRQTLLAPPPPRLVAHVFAGERQAYQAEYGRTVLDATLFSMSSNAVLFKRRYYQQFGADRKLHQQLKSLQIFQDLHITRASKQGLLPLGSDETDGPPVDLDDRPEEEQPEVSVGEADEKAPKCIYVSYFLRVGGIFIRNNHYRPQPLVLADYLSLRTGGVTAAASKTGKARLGRSCTSSRLLYCRLLWRWGAWLGESTRHLTQQEENFGDLCELLGWQASAVAAVRLNVLLTKVCTLPSIPFTARVKQSKQRLAVNRAADGSLPPHFLVVLYKKGHGQPAEAAAKISQLGLGL